MPPIRPLAASIAALASCIFLLATSAPSVAQDLTLAEAERIAVERDAMTREMQAQALGVAAGAHMPLARGLAGFLAAQHAVISQVQPSTPGKPASLMCCCCVLLPLLLPLLLRSSGCEHHGFLQGVQCTDSQDGW